MNDEAFKLTADGIGNLLKIGARETEKIANERDFFVKFAMAVEILPRLERAGVVHFPIGMEMHKKAKRMAEKSTDELQKLAYLAKHSPEATNHGVKELDNETKVASASEYGKLTEAFVGLMRE